jgi:hypothetical protein
MTVTVPVLLTLTLGRQLFANNSYTEFHENPVRSSVVRTGSSKGEQKDMVFTEGVAFGFVLNAGSQK